MNAWSLAMEEEESKTYSEQSFAADHNGADGGEESSLLRRLIARMDRMEARAQQTEKEMASKLEELRERLILTEQRIPTPSDSNLKSLPWRKIQVYSFTTNSLDSVEHGEFEGGEERFEPDEEYLLPQDVYSILASWKSNSRPFWISLLVISVQIAFLGLLLEDQIGSTGESDLLLFPAPVNVPAIVHASQALAIIVAMFDQDDLRSAIEGFFDGLPTRFKGDVVFRCMNKPQWNLSCGIRFLQGFLSVFASVVLAVQSETVFDVLLNFLGVKFVSELDDLAFKLYQLGYFGEQCQQASKCVEEAHFQRDDRNKVDAWFRKYAHVIGVFGMLAFLLALFFFVLVSQNNGDLSTKEISLTLGEGSVPFAALFGGCYRISRTGQTYDRRIAYEQIGYEDDGGHLGFCNNVGGEKAWTFTFNSTDPCSNIYARTAATTTFNVLQLGSQWYSKEGIALGNVQISRVLDYSAECGKATPDSNDKLCENLDVKRLIDTDQYGFRSTPFIKMKVNSTAATIFTYQALRHPIYVRSSSTPTNYELIIFTGRTWVLTSEIKIESTTADTESQQSMQDYMDKDTKFLETLEKIVKRGTFVELVTSSITSTEGTPISPLGLRWYYMQESEDPDFNYPAADLSRPQDMVLSCANCDNVTNPCNYGGICRQNKTCDCVNGGTGALCEERPLGDGKCNQYFNKELYGWDGGDCCGKSTNSFRLDLNPSHSHLVTSSAWCQQGGTCVGPECGLKGLSLPFGMDRTSVLDYNASGMGFENCADPSMATLTMELNSFQVLDDPDWIGVLGDGREDPFCSTATLTVRCNGITYIHFPQHILLNQSDCNLSFTETIHVPYGSKCELSTNIPCFGAVCIGHTVSVYYGNGTDAVEIQSLNVKNESLLSFGVPPKCLTYVLLNHSSTIFDLSTHQGKAASALSNDGLSEYLCMENSDLVLERYALAVFNASVHFSSSYWGRSSNCHGFGAPAVRTTCTNDSITTLVLGIDVVGQLGTIPSEISLLSNLEHLALRKNSFLSSIPSEIAQLKKLVSLELWECKLTGTIPTALGTLPVLSTLALANNRLTGTIPTELEKLQLTGLWLGYNTLTGPLPSELGALTSLETLDLAINMLTGEIPSELFALSALRICNLAANNFTGGLAPPVCRL